MQVRKGRCGRRQVDQGAALSRRDRQPVGIRAVLAGAAAAGRSYWHRILAVAIATSVVTAAVEIVVDEYANRADLSLAIFADLSASAVSLLGAVFLSGFVCKLTAAAARGEDVSVKQVLRILPWVRLIGADLLVALAVIVGLLLLVLPGLVAINLFGVVGPVIEIEDRRILAALRRSAQLVKPHFWSVALLVTLPVALAGELDSVVPEPRSLRAVLANLALRGVVEALLEAGIALIVVQLSRRLIELDLASAGTHQGQRGLAVPGAEAGGHLRVFQLVADHAAVAVMIRSEDGQHVGVVTAAQ